MPNSKQMTVMLAITTALSGAVASTLYANAQRTGPNTQALIEQGEPGDADIRRILVKESIDRYTGSCACPYSRKFNEKLFRFPNQFRDHPMVRCGEDSEYIRPGGPTVFCYPSDVPIEMVEAYREHLRSTFLTEPQPKF